jgi:hypothetical protein
MKPTEMRSLSLASLGAVLEYFDFQIYTFVSEHPPALRLGFYGGVFVGVANCGLRP